MISQKTLRYDEAVTLTAVPPISPGWRFSVIVTRHRKWWQFWRPASWQETSVYECAASGSIATP